ncbi:endopeptidase La [Chondromyces apiculatus]|uniref:Lon protease n=1 Tax=Chondromyces apiculatus DSM 436 TaxID=1192034 RepID=A0A017T2M4_9BACT|nr:endopeptidase La [Chondromyces apiculatus]EYF03060.1 ATP-dependent protease La [Chondromyces apiculatus DSM 436]
MSQLRGGGVAPRSPFPLLPLRTGVLFPGTSITLPVGRSRSVALLADIKAGAILGVVAQRDPRVEDPQRDDLHDIGVFARVVDVARVANGGYRLTLEGLDRMVLTALVQHDPYWLAEGNVAPEFAGDAEEGRVVATALRDRARELGPQLGSNLADVAAAKIEPGSYADLIAAALGMSTDKEMQVLSELRVVPRVKLVAELLNEAVHLADLKRKADADVRKEIGKNQRDAILREQIRALQRQLGDEGDDLSALRRRLDEAGLSEEARTVVDRELRRMESMNPQQAEHHVIRTYLEWIADLPWSKRAGSAGASEAEQHTLSGTDLDAVAKKLDEDHRGLDDVKRRILEHMAVLKLAGKTRATILCLAGPPGVGKTSLGQSIADATGRPLVRISLGGVHDESELRGHRRTYVGALPGRIIHAMKKAKVKNPVILLDEIDKLGTSYRGSPEAALLEILDPEQNKTFQDHYLELPFDLSEVLFVCTANDLSSLSAPLRDRLEVIEISGYTADEKTAIARSHLIPKHLREHAIDPSALTITDVALAAILRDYTREAGVRQLGRELTKLCRALALEVARASDGKLPRLHVDVDDLPKYLGKARFFSEIAERTQVPGVATGLAWTPVGGDILFIETSRMPGKGRLEITGQLGDVMKESAKAALTYVRSHAEEIGVDVAQLEQEDLHIHVPAGGVPKDGPSAGVTMFTALTSLLSGRRVRSDTAMTGECTLRGRVLPVGGIKSKVLAAHRAGITRVILPQKNARDLEDVPKEVRDHLTIILADDMSQVIAAALEETPVTPTLGSGGLATPGFGSSGTT